LAVDLPLNRRSPLAAMRKLRGSCIKVQMPRPFALLGSATRGCGSEFQLNVNSRLTVALPRSLAFLTACRRAIPCR
jgi:hypothetical protein